MTVFVNLNRKVQVGTAWTGTAPGLPGTQTISGTITTASDLSTWAQNAEPGASVAMQDGTTFGTGGYTVQYPGLKSGDDLVFDLVGDFAASQDWAIINTTLGGLGALVYADCMPTSASRGATNPSFVCAGYIKEWKPMLGNVGSIAKMRFTLAITGAFAYLTS